MEKILQFLADARTFYFTTVDGDKPRVRPFGFTMEYEGKLYFGIGAGKASLKQLEVNPNVEVCATNAKDQWIRIKGVANLDIDNAKALDKAFETLPMLYKLYPNKKDFKLLYLTDLNVEIADMQGNFEKLM